MGRKKELDNKKLISMIEKNLTGHSITKKYKKNCDKLRDSIIFRQ